MLAEILNFQGAKPCLGVGSFSPLKLKSSKLVTRAEGVNSWHTNEEDHNGYTGTNSRSYVYTTPNPPSNPYCEAILTATDEKGDEYAVWKGTLRDAK